MSTRQSLGRIVRCSTCSGVLRFESTQPHGPGGMYLHQSSGSYWAGTGDSRHHVTIDLDDPTQRRQTTLNLGDP